MPDHAALLAWRDHVAALRAPACDMAHEAIPRRADGTPLASAASPSGYARIGICAPSVRERHIGCSHTMARLVLRDALAALGDDDDALAGALRDLENAVSLLDHRRYDAETDHARAVAAGADGVAARAAIESLVAEHRACAAWAVALRDAVLARLDATLAATVVRSTWCCDSDSSSVIPGPERSEGARNPYVAAQGVWIPGSPPSRVNAHMAAPRNDEN